MERQILKRDGRTEPFEPKKITHAIFKAALACGGSNEALAEQLTEQALEEIDRRYGNRMPDVEGVQEIVEKVLIENGHAKTAKAYILYRDKRRSAREINALIGATI